MPTPTARSDSAASKPPSVVSCACRSAGAAPPLRAGDPSRASGRTEATFRETHAEAPFGNLSERSIGVRRPFESLRANGRATLRETHAEAPFGAPQLEAPFGRLRAGSEGTSLRGTKGAVAQGLVGAASTAPTAWRSFETPTPPRPGRPSAPTGGGQASGRTGRGEGGG